MKGMKGKFLKKLKSMKPPIGGYLKQDRILQVNASDGFVETYEKNSSLKVHNQLNFPEPEHKKIHQSSVKVQEPDIIDVSDLMKDLEDQEMEVDDEDIDNKENIGPPKKAKEPVESNENSQISMNLELPQLRSDNHTQTPLSEIDISSFRRPVLNSGSLFDPNLLAAFQQAVIQHIQISEADRRARARDEQESGEKLQEEPPIKARRVEEDQNPLLDFEEKCPPGGSEAVIFYSTTLRGIRKTFEDCNKVRFLLESFRVVFFERDVSMHMEFKEELWRNLGEKAVLPRLFIKGRYIGGAEEVLGLHEQGKLRILFEGIPIDGSNGPCEGCAGFRFVLCFNCSGSRKIVDDDDGLLQMCPHCNENGLIICPNCC